MDQIQAYAIHYFVLWVIVFGGLEIVCHVLRLQYRPLQSSARWLARQIGRLIRWMVTTVINTGIGLVRAAVGGLLNGLNFGGGGARRRT